MPRQLQPDRCCDIAAIHQASACDHGQIDGCGDFAYELQGRDHARLEWSGKSSAVRAGLRALRDDSIHARIGQQARFRKRGGGTENQDVSLLKPRHRIPIGNAKSEAEDGWSHIQNGFELLRERIGFGEGWRGSRKAERLVNLSQELQHWLRISVVVRIPSAGKQVHLKWFFRERFDALDGGGDLIWRHISSAE